MRVAVTGILTFLGFGLSFLGITQHGSIDPITVLTMVLAGAVVGVAAATVFVEELRYLLKV